MVAAAMTGHCCICHQKIDTGTGAAATTNRPQPKTMLAVRCVEPETCPMVAHLKCLAKHFLTVETAQHASETAAEVSIRLNYKHMVVTPPCSQFNEGIYT